MRMSLRPCRIPKKKEPATKASAVSHPTIVLRVRARFRSALLALLSVAFWAFFAGARKVRLATGRLKPRCSATSSSVA